MWKVIKDEKTVSMFRTVGKTLPCVVYNIAENKIHARDNNGKTPSKTYSCVGCTANTVRDMLNNISKPHPASEVVAAFITQCK